MSRQSPLSPLPANPARRAHEADDEYRVYRSGNWFFRYDVSGPPYGSLLTVTCSLWWARRAIRRNRRKTSRPGWWTNQVVWREEA